MIDYILTNALFISGVFLFILSVISKLKIKFPAYDKKEIVKTFYSEEWDSLLVSGVVLLIWNISLALIDVNKIILPLWYEKWGEFAFALVLGYCGQRLAYSVLSTAEGVLQKKVDQLQNTVDQNNLKYDTNNSK
jgi:hypothetical protein